MMRARPAWSAATAGVARTAWWWVGVIAAAIVIGMPLAYSATSVRVPAARASWTDPTDLVFVTEDLAADMPGCDAISVLNVVDGSIVHRGATHVSPGRLAVNSKLSTGLATLANGWGGGLGGGDVAQCAPALVALELSSPQHADPRSLRITGAMKFATHGGVTFMPDDTFVVAEANYLASDCRRTQLKARPPYFISRGRLVNDDPAHPSGVEVLDQTPVDDLAIDIFYSSVADRLVAALANGTVVTLDPRTMRLIDSPIVGGSTGMQVFAPSDEGHRAGALHATMSPDGGQVVMNGMRDGSMLIFDLERRTSRREPIGDPVSFVGGVAWNAGWVNRGLLAVHLVDSIGIFRIEEDGVLTERARIAIPPPYGSERLRSELLDGGETGPMFTVAWSASGEHVIAASSADAAEFVVIGVADEGRSLAIQRFLTACPDLNNFPNDIWTANGLVVTPSPTPTFTPTSTQTPLPSDTATPTTERTATPSAVPTVNERPIYLPLTLREHCTPDQQRLDIALVLDASTSMLERTSAGRTKLEAATEAARVLLDLLQLDTVNGASGDGDQAALIAFNADTALLQPFTNVRADLDAALGRIAVAQQTRIDLGIQAAADELASARHAAG
ncbi:MAG: VWA domain-containing protein, partial [Ardenticatenales bacterium]